MKKLIQLAIRCFLVQFFLPAVVVAQADIKSQIADVLAAMPAQNKRQLDKNMQAITAFGDAGITQLVAGLKPAGSGDNSSLEYAINSYSAYVMQPAKEDERKLAVRAYGAALGALQDNTSKQFIIKQLQQIGHDEAVPALQPYLASEPLAGPAARALAQINTTSAAEVLLKALAASTGAIRLSIIEALGYARYNASASAITTIADTKDVPLRKICLYALARIALPVSAPVLSHAAEKAGYTYDNTAAVTAYILYLQNLSEQNKSKATLNLVLSLLSNARNAGQVHTQTAALQILVEMEGRNSLNMLERAMYDKSIAYRAAVLGFATKFQSPALDKEWLGLLPALSPAAQVQVIDFLGQTRDTTLLLGLQKLLKDKNPAIRIAAITAAGKIGGTEALPVLLVVLKLGDSTDVSVVKQALLTLKCINITAPVIKAFPGMPAAGKEALLYVLAARSANNAVNTVFAAVQSRDSGVHNAAVRALAAVVSQADIDKLVDLLNASQPGDVASLQFALIAASSGIKDTVERTNKILSALKAAPAGRQYLYLTVLAATGSKQALAALQQAYANGDAQSKAAAMAALAETKSPRAARILLQIAQQPGSGEAALNGYINIIKTEELPADQKLLMLKEAMAVAKTDAQRKSIIEEAGECKTFLSLLFAGKYLNDLAVQQQAAHAVMDIALANNEFTGDIVIGLLSKTADVLTGQDADYDKQAIKKHIVSITGKQGFVPMFNGTDLTGWKGLVANPIARAKMNPDTLAAEQAKADKIMRDGWFAKDGLLVFGGNGENLCTVKQYGDFEMFVDWKITKDGDAGIYLRGSPQVQIWDTSRVSVGAQVGSGGLYNNQTNQSKPLVLADNAIGEWNSFHIIMRGDKVTVYLNGVLVTDNIVLENYWDRTLPIFLKEQIELQAHGTYVAYRDLYIKELTNSAPFVMGTDEKKDGYTVLFDGSNLDNWTGNTTGYKVDQGSILVDTADGNPGNMYTKQQYGNFVLRFEFQLTPGANNGIGIRTPLEGDAAYVGMEIQVLDNEAPEYKDLHAYQYHGSVYGVIPAKRGFLKPTGQWNYEEITAVGPKIKVVLNGEVILDGNIDEASINGTADHREHPGLKRPAGHIGLLGHGSVVRFRNVRIKEL